VTGEGSHESAFCKCPMRARPGSSLDVYDRGGEPRRLRARWNLVRSDGRRHRGHQKAASTIPPFTQREPEDLVSFRVCLSPSGFARLLDHSSSGSGGSAAAGTSWSGRTVSSEGNARSADVAGASKLPRRLRSARVSTALVQVGRCSWSRSAKWPGRRPRRVVVPSTGASPGWSAPP